MAVDLFLLAWQTVGPLGLLLFIVLKVAPSTIKQISESRAQQAQNRDALTAGPLTLAQQGFKVLETQLEAGTKREERQAANDAAMREILQSLLTEFSGFKAILIDFNTDYHTRMSAVEVRLESVVNFIKTLAEKGSTL